MDNYTLETLDVYNEAELFSDKIRSIVETWDWFKKDTIGKQITRAADFISANIAEGYGRYYYKESKQFYFYSRGSIQKQSHGSPNASAAKLWMKPTA